MKARPRTTAVRLTPGDARLILWALECVKPEVQVPEQLDRLVEEIRTTIPDS